MVDVEKDGCKIGAGIAENPAASTRTAMRCLFANFETQSLNQFFQDTKASLDYRYECAVGGVKTFPAKSQLEITTRSAY